MRAIAQVLDGGLSSRLRSEQGRLDYYRPFFAAILVFTAYYIGAKIGFALTFRPHPVSVLWPPNSILLAALLLTPVRVWWVILLAAFPAHLAAQLQSNVPPAMILCWFISNSCEALIGAGCVRYLIDRPVRFDRLGNVGMVRPLRWAQEQEVRYSGSCRIIYGFSLAETALISLARRSLARRRLLGRLPRRSSAKAGAV
jgi:hypothetical protein